MKTTMSFGQFFGAAMLLACAFFVGGCGTHPASGAPSAAAPAGTPSPSLVAHDAAKEKRDGKGN